MTEKPLNEYLDMEAYDVVSGDTHRALKEQLEAAQERIARFERILAQPSDKWHDLLIASYPAIQPDVSEREAGEQAAGTHVATGTRSETSDPATEPS